MAPAIPTRPRRHRLPRAVLLVLGAIPFAAAAQSVELHATLRGQDVVSATESPGSGEAHAWLSEDGRVRIEFAYGRLESGATDAGLYEGEATENGDRIAAFDLPRDATDARLDGITVSLSPEEVASMRAGETYVQVETTTYPDGAIRGQLRPQPVRLRSGAEPEEDD